MHTLIHERTEFDMLFMLIRRLILFSSMKLSNLIPNLFFLFPRQITSTLQHLVQFSLSRLSGLFSKQRLWGCVTERLCKTLTENGMLRFGFPFLVMFNLPSIFENFHQQVIIKHSRQNPSDFRVGMGRERNRGWRKAGKTPHLRTENETESGIRTLLRVCLLLQKAFI